MAINSYGYPGTINSVQWSKISGELGAAYSVADYGDLAGSVVVGPDRTISIAPGTAFGRGVMDVVTAPVQVQLDTVSTGSRWDTIVLRRNWTTNASTIVKINGGGTPGVAGGRLSGPGVQDDQPLMLVQIVAGSTTPGLTLDLRTWNAKVTTAGNLTALVDSQYGDEAVVGGIRYRRTIDGTGAGIWAPPDDAAYCQRYQAVTYNNYGAQVFQDFNFAGVTLRGPAGFFSVTPGSGRINVLQLGLYMVGIDVCLSNDRPTKIEGRVVDSLGNILCRNYGEGQTTAGPYITASEVHYLSPRSISPQIMNQAGLGKVWANTPTTPNRFFVTRLGS